MFAATLYEDGEKAQHAFPWQPRAGRGSVCLLELGTATAVLVGERDQAVVARASLLSPAHCSSPLLRCTYSREGKCDQNVGIWIFFFFLLLLPNLKVLCSVCFTLRLLFFLPSLQKNVLKPIRKLYVCIHTYTVIGGED